MGCSGLGCKEVLLAALGVATVLWGLLALVYSLVLAWAGWVWTQDTNIANLTAPGVIASVAMIIAGLLSAGPGSGMCCRPQDSAARRRYLISALVCRLIPIAATIYLIIFVVREQWKEAPPAPPSPPAPPPGEGSPPSSPMPAWPPQAPYPPSWPPQPPFAPYEPSAGPNAFLWVLLIVSLAVVVVAPVVEILIICDLGKERPKVSAGGDL